MVDAGDMAPQQARRGGTLASSGLNATGASAILNIGHWVTNTAPVHSHVPGSNNFTCVLEIMNILLYKYITSILSCN